MDGQSPAKTVVIPGGKPLESKWSGDSLSEDTQAPKGGGLLDSKWSVVPNEHDKPLATPPPSRDTVKRRSHEKRHHRRRGAGKPREKDVPSGPSMPSPSEKSQPSFKEPWKFVNEDYDWADEA